jgi:TatD DNase family protein
LYLKQFDEDLEVVLARASQRGVERMMVPGIDLLTSRQAVSLAEKHPSLFAAVGVHPTSVNSWRSGTLKELEALSRHPKVVAIGEIGLDYYRMRASPEAQKVVLQAQLELAAQLQLPVIIHNRDAIQDLWTMLRDWLAQLPARAENLTARPGVLHAFDAALEIAREAARLNFLIGIGGPVTYPKAGEKRALVKNLPLSAILTETDAPFLSPQPVRGQRNEPANVTMIVDKIAEISNLSVDQVALATSQNADRLFLWSPSR